MIILEKLNKCFPFDRNGTLDQALNERTNNLTFIRLCAAILVVIDHAFPLGNKPRWLMTRIGFSLGEWAVVTFFFLSGILIAKSWDEDPNIFHFITKRVLRIFPGILTALTFTTFVIGSLTTNLPIKDYLRHSETWSYLAHNALLFPQKTGLPGVFTQNPFPLSVNNSLWTIPVEFFFYGCLLCVGILGAVKHKYFSLTILCTLLYINLHILPRGKLDPPLFIFMPTYALWSLSLCFFFGVVCYSFRDKIVLNFNWAITAGVVYLISFDTPYVWLTRVFLWGYFLLCFGFQNWKICQSTTKHGDFSYGIYIYGFPVQQYFYHLYPHMTPFENILVCVPVTYLFGMLSWKLVKKPSLSLKRFVKKKKQETLV